MIPRDKNGQNFFRGFTLIELLVVISIISLLSSVVLTSLNSARMKARDANRIAQMGQVMKALEMYFNNHGEYPTEDPDLLDGMDLAADHVAEGWKTMMTPLRTENFISWSAIKNTEGEKFTFVPLAEAAGTVGYYAVSVQDPFYKAGTDYRWSYGYKRFGVDHYIIRVRLENVGNSLLNNSYEGVFLDGAITDWTSCDKSMGYYCLYQ